MNKSLDNLIIHSINEIFDHQISNINYFKAALTHKSTSSENYERLEILGDSIIQFIITEMLFLKFPDYSEGKITVIRQNLVNSKTLSEVFLSLNLEMVFKKINPKLTEANVHSDVLEAILGALYLDSSIEVVKTTINKTFSPLISDSLLKKDAKTILQQYLHARKLRLPVYLTTKTHQSNFKYLISCEILDLKIRETIYSNKVKPAEQELAAIIYKILHENN